MTHILYSYLPTSKEEEVFCKHLSKFPNEFKERLLAYRNWKDSLALLLGRFLLAYGLFKYFGFKKGPIDLGYTNTKKPYLKDTSLTFNISHSKGLVALAISNKGEIGLDVEKMIDFKWQELKSQMTEFEYAEISGSKNEIDAFYTYWTQKEAVIKADGNGLNIDLKSFEISRLSTVLNGKSYFLKPLELDVLYKCHIASTNPLYENKLEIKKIEIEKLEVFIENNPNLCFNQ